VPSGGTSAECWRTGCARSLRSRGLCFAAETVAKHTARLGRLVLRASPMVLLIFVAPTVVVLAVLPAVSDLSKPRTAALAFVQCTRSL
jgi:hypothetical protein